MSKTLEVEGVPNTALVRIKWTNGGELPAELQGNFTSTMYAKARIAEWYARNPHRDPDAEPQPRGPGRPRRES